MSMQWAGRCFWAGLIAMVASAIAAFAWPPAAIGAAVGAQAVGLSVAFGCGHVCCKREVSATFRAIAGRESIGMRGRASVRPFSEN